MLGISAYRTAFGQPHALLGPQKDAIGAAWVWVLPNPSGLNTIDAPADLARLFREFRLAVIRPSQDPEGTT